MEVSEYLVGSPAFKAGDTGDPRMAGSIPVHLRHSWPLAKNGGGAACRRKAKSGREAPSIRAAERKRLFARTGFAASFCRGRNPSPSGSSMLGGWPEAGSARTGFAASFRRTARSEPEGSRLALRLAGGRHRPNRLRSFGLPAPILTRSIQCVVLSVALLAFVLPSSAGAQARLISVTPDDGASVADLEEVVFEFDSLLLANGAEVRVVRRDGTDVPVALIEVERSTLTATIAGQLTSGNYEISYSVRSADGALNEGSIRVSVDSPEQSLSGGLVAVIGLAIAMFGTMFFVLWRDQRRRPTRRR